MSYGQLPYGMVNPRDSEFEEDSFEDDFEPDDNILEQKKRVKRLRAGGKGSATAAQLAMMMQGVLGNPERKGGRLPPPIPSVVTITRRATDDRAEHVDWSNSTKRLKVLAAQVVIRTTGKQSLTKIILPSYLYPVVFAEAAKLREDEAITHLVSTWPFAILDMNEARIDVEHLLATPDDVPCMADAIVRGLLYRKRKFCHLQMMILPKEVKLSAELVRYFLRVPLIYVRNLPNINLLTELRNAKVKDAENYIRNTLKFEVKKPINYYAYNKDKVSLVIAIPSAVVHWLGKKLNITETLSGLALQKHSPFVFHFENLAFMNFVETKALTNALDMVVNPERIKKLVLRNRRVFRPEHIITLLANNKATFSRFTGLRGFFCKISSLLGDDLPEDFDGDTMAPAIAAVYNAWPHLTQLNLNEQPMKLNFLRSLLPVNVLLVKLSLVRVKLKESDLLLLTECRHLDTLRILRLDNNELHEFVPTVQLLLSRLRSIVTLKTVGCRLKARHCLALATSLSASTTLRTWHITDNRMYHMRHLKEFLGACSQIVTLRFVGCRPREFHVLMDQLVMPNKKCLTDAQRMDLEEFAIGLNLQTF